MVSSAQTKYNGPSRRFASCSPRQRKSVYDVTQYSIAPASLMIVGCVYTTYSVAKEGGSRSLSLVLANSPEGTGN